MSEHLRVMRLALLLLLAVTVFEGRAAAVSISGSARIGVYYRDGLLPSSTNNYRIWARRSDGHLATLLVGYDPDVLTANWVDRTPGNPPASRLVHQRGIDAISWENGAGQWEEHAVYVGGDGNLYDWRLLDGLTGANEWLSITPEPGHPLTGFVAIARRVDRVFIFATTVDFRLYAWEVTDWGAGTSNRYLLAGAGVSSSTMITASTAENGTYVRVFFNKTDNTVWSLKFTGAGPWTASTFAGPGAPASPCGLLAAAEGNIGGTAGYKTYLFCTRTGGTPHSTRIYYRSATGSGSTNFGAAWSSKSTPSGSVSTSGFRLTARRRAEAGNSTIEAFHLGASYQNLYQVEHTAGAADLGSVTDRGWDGESTAHPGGIVAAGPDARGDSDAYFVGQAHSASWLYRRVPSGDPGPWMNYGSGESWKNYATGTIATESSTAMFGGRAVVAAVYGCADPATCPGADTIWDNKTLWSNDEGDSFNPAGPQQVTPPPGAPPPPWDPNPAGSGDTWKHSFDPVVDFDDGGTAYLIHLTKVRDKNGVNRGSGIFLWTSSNGTFTYQGMLDADIPSGCDHPWLAVRRDRNGLDQIHAAWEVAGSVKYVQAPVNDLGQLFDPANAILINGAAGVLSIPRVTVSQGPFEDAYVVTPQLICRIPEGAEAPDAHGCHGYLEFGEDYKADSDGTLSFNGTDRTVRAIRNLSVATSWRDRHRVYYAWQKRELGQAEGSGPFDMRVASLDYDPIFGVITPGPIVSAIFPANDGSPQAFPELTVSEGPGIWNEIAYLSWYDWGQGLTCNSLDEDTGLWAVRANRCYQVRSALSTDQGLTWSSIGPNPFPWVSDPFYAPVMTGASGPPYDERFIGDYHAVTGDLLHTAHVAIMMPVGSADDEHANSIERGWMSDGFWYPYY